MNRAMAWLAGVGGALALGVLAYRFSWPTPGTAAGPNPDWWFAQTYDLRPGEIVRLIPPPYSQARRKHTSGRPGGMLIFTAGRMDQPYTALTYMGTIGSGVWWCGSFDPQEFEWPADELRNIPVEGDWTIRRDLPRSQRLAEVQTILRQCVGRKLVIEAQREMKEVLVAHGRYQFRQLDPRRTPGAVQLYIETAYPAEVGPSYVDVRNFCGTIASLTGLRVICESPDASARVTYFYDISSLEGLKGNRRKTDLLLANITAQTGLQFDRVVREVEVYRIREETASMKERAQP